MSTSKAKPSKSKKTDKIESVSDDGAEVQGSEAEYNRYLAAAMALAAEAVVPFRADASLAYHNVVDASAALLAERAWLAAELPKLDLDHVAKLPQLALAVVFAVAQVDRGATIAGLPDKLAQARALRDLMLTQADALVKAGLVPARAVQKIREGKGLIDTAQDLVDLAALYTKYSAKIRGKSAVTAEMIKTAAKLGTELLQTLRPRRARKGPKGGQAAQDAADVRDRLWTLLAQGAEQTRRAGVWRWGEHSVDEHVPALQAHRAVAAAKKTAAKKTKPAAGATTAAEAAKS